MPIGVSFTGSISRRRARKGWGSSRTAGSKRSTPRHGSCTCAVVMLRGYEVGPAESTRRRRGDAEGPRRVVAEDLALARLRNGLLLETVHPPRPRAVRVRIVGVEGEVVVAGELDGGRQGALVAAAGDEDVAPEVLRRSHLQIRVLGVAREIPVLLHALEQIGHPAGVRLDVHDA